MTERTVARKRFAFFQRIVLSMAAALLLSGLAANAQQSDRARQFGKRVRCMCGGCNDTASTCFHVGGAFSGPCETAKATLKTIDERLLKGDSEDLILQSFVQQYGPVVYVEPPHSGFGQIAWAMPVVYLILGTGLVGLVIRRWRKRPAHAMPAATDISAEMIARARQRVARETED
jgi:cytochrome c-type biogenesis protein CcmH/NrfF